MPVTTVPPLTRLTESQATTRLQAVGLVVGQLIDTEQLAGSRVVVGSNPKAGVVVEVGTAVDLLMSKVFHP